MRAVVFMATNATGLSSGLCIGLLLYPRGTGSSEGDSCPYRSSQAAPSAFMPLAVITASQSYSLSLSNLQVLTNCNPLIAAAHLH